MLDLVVTEIRITEVKIGDILGRRDHDLIALGNMQTG